MDDLQGVSIKTCFKCAVKFRYIFLRLIREKKVVYLMFGLFQKEDRYKNPN